jgi:signal transduction histidine kinase
MWFSRTSSSVGLFALLLAVVALSLVGSLVAADRALARAERRAVELDARATAVLAEHELRLRSRSLEELFGSLLTPPSRDSTVVPRGFERVWIEDTLGHVHASAPPGADVPRMPTYAADSTFSVHAYAGRDSTDGALMVAVPLSHRGRRLGVAVGMIAGRHLLSSLQSDATERRWAMIAHDGRMIASIGAATPGSSLTAATRVRLAGDTLMLTVAHAREGKVQRTALWAVGAAALLALMAALARERRQGLRVAARTSELERLYQEVARSNRMKSEFLANISHELRTPLNAIVGFVEMLREGVYGALTPRQALPVDRIAASATHLRLLVDRLLDIAKIAAGRVDMHFESLVLRPFVLNVASEMESLIAERGLALSIGIGPSVPRVRTDQTHLRQILINLIGNAVKYTTTGGIQIRARFSGDAGVPQTDDAEVPLDPRLPDPNKPWVALQVSDTGIGIPRDDLERIFDEFEQVNAGPRTDSARRGTGLGLAISRRLARLLGGDITVVSEVGRGSTFTVWLPVDASENVRRELALSDAPSSA